MLFSELYLGFPDGTSSKEPICQCRRHKRLGFDQEDLEEEMATHFSILAWEISWTEESVGLWSMGLQRVYDLATEHKRNNLLS